MIKLALIIILITCEVLICASLQTLGDVCMVFAVIIFWGINWPLAVIILDR